MKFKKITVGNSSYEIAFDDKCIVLKNIDKENKIWLCKNILKYLYFSVSQCKSCNLKNALINLIIENGELELKYRKIGRDLSLVLGRNIHPQQVKTHIEILVKNKIIKQENNILTFNSQL